MMYWTNTKKLVGSALFKLNNIQRIHIIGCSRSGTTMMHLAMSYFDNTVLSNEETDVDAPYLSERLSIVAQARSLGGNVAYITKRNYGWFEPSRTQRLVDRTRREQIGIIHIVRDPRDVMTSVHAGQQEQKAYVSPEHWLRSTQAAKRVFDALADYPRKIEIRYEDVVTHPERVALSLAATFGLVPADANRSFSMIKENLENNGAHVHPGLIKAVHKLRPMDADSVGRWRRTSSCVQSLLPNVNIEEFCARYQYPVA